MTADRSPEEQAAVDAAAAFAAALAGRPLTRRQQQLADRAAAVARRLAKLDRNRKAGVR
jgi:hypothetical protein